MLINHLCHRVSKQNHVLVEGFNLPLQLDAVDQINGNRNMFSTQGIEKRILKELAFVIAHDMFRVQELISLDNITATGQPM